MGDALVAIDGRSVLGQVLAAPVDLLTHTAQPVSTFAGLLTGAPGSTVAVTLKRVDGALETVNLLRSNVPIAAATKDAAPLAASVSTAPHPSAQTIEQAFGDASLTSALKSVSFSAGTKAAVADSGLKRVDAPFAGPETVRLDAAKLAQLSGPPPKPAAPVSKAAMVDSVGARCSWRPRLTRCSCVPSTPS